MKARTNPATTYIGFFVACTLIAVWCGLCIYPAIWHIATDGACYRRYGIWRATSFGVGDVSIPFYDMYHKINYPAHNAVIRNQLARLTSIPKDRLKPDRFDNFHMTPLAYAARSGLKEELQYLLTNGANPNITTYQNMTALMLAVKHERREVAMILLEHGANASVADSSGVTATHIAAEKNYDTILAKIADLGNSLDLKDPKGLTPLDYAVKKGAMKATMQLAASGAECSFSQIPRNDEISIFLKLWQEAGTTPFIPPYIAEAESGYGRTRNDANLPAELPVNVKPETFRNRGQ